MIHQIVYFGYLAACCAYIFVVGSRDEKWGGAIVLAATFFSLDAVQGQTNWLAPEFNLIIVDGAAFFCACILAMKSDRFWPLWLAGFCLVGAATHFSTQAMPEFVPKAYAWLAGFWAYPAIGSIVFGAHNHSQRQGTAASG